MLHILPKSDGYRSQATHVAMQPSDIHKYQHADVSEEDALAAALEASHTEVHGPPQPADATSFNSSSHSSISMVAGTSSTISASRELPVSRRPKISTQLGGAWLEVLNADAADEVEKVKLASAEAESAAEAKKNVDVMWYDQVSRPHLA